MRKNVEPGETPAVISVSMIDQDLKNGISKSDMAIKYSIKPWEVDRMFEHPDLKGRRPSKRKPLSFQFVDDLNQVSRKPATEDTSEPQFSERKDSTEVDPNLNERVAQERASEFKQTFSDAQEALNPNQVTLEEGIDEAIKTATKAKEQIEKAQNSLSDMLSPTEFETKLEDLAEDEFEVPTVQDTMDLVEEQEIEITGGTTFNL